MYSIRDNERVTKSFYIISSVLHAFWLVLTYDLLENRRIDDVIIKTCFNSLLYKTIDSKLLCVCSVINQQLTGRFYTSHSGKGSCQYP